MVIDLDDLVLKSRVIVDNIHDWGYQLRLVNTDSYCGKFLVLTNWASSSIHYHKIKAETFIILTGKLRLRTQCGPEAKREIRILFVGEQFTLLPSQIHQMNAIKLPVVILEVSTHDDDSDTYKLEEWP